jgi:putative Holliday junction resolvase
MQTKIERVMGLDFGTRQIGVAMSDESATIAQPYCVIKREGNKKDIEKILDIIRSHDISLMVIGVSYHDDGNVSAMGERALNFGRLLEDRSGGKVVFIDETLTSVMAEDILMGGGVRRKKRKAVVDKIAAAIILQDYLRKVKRNEN